MTEEVTDAGLVVLKDTDLVDLPEYELASGEILLLLNEAPWVTPIAAGTNAADVDSQQRDGGPAYVVDSRLNLPNTGKFMLLLRSKFDQNSKDKNIQDYAGNGFFEDFSTDVSTQFWPRIGQYLPSASSIANFGDNTFASRNQAWKRKRYQANDGHHKDAWEAVGTQGGLGYDPGTELSTSPGTPGYENDALRAGINRLVDGEVSISEIMYDRGPNGNSRPMDRTLQQFTDGRRESKRMGTPDPQSPRPGRPVYRRHHRIQRCGDFAESDDPHRLQGCCDESPGRSGL